MTNHCGTCTACCKAYAIPELKKPAGPWCEHCEVGKGCRIYDLRPKRCVDYECLWLESQGRADPLERMSLELRPDKSRVIFSGTSNPNIVVCTTLRGGAERQPLVRRLIEIIAGNGGGVAVGSPGAMTTKLITAAGEKEVQMSEPDADGVQWALNND